MTSRGRLSSFPGLSVNGESAALDGVSLKSPITTIGAVEAIDKECQDIEALHDEAENLLRQMGVSEKDIAKLDQDNLVAYYQIKKKQLEWFVKNKEWLQKMGVKMEDVIPLEYSFEKR